MSVTSLVWNQDLCLVPSVRISEVPRVDERTNLQNSLIWCNRFWSMTRAVSSVMDSFCRRKNYPFRRLHILLALIRFPQWIALVVVVDLRRILWSRDHLQGIQTVFFSCLLVSRPQVSLKSLSHLDSTLHRSRNGSIPSELCTKSEPELCSQWFPCDLFRL